MSSERGPSAEDSPEEGMTNERFREIHNILKTGGVSDKEIALFAGKQQEGGLKAMVIKAQNKEKQEFVQEFTDELKERVPQMTDEELKDHSERYFPLKEGDAMSGADFFDRELNIRKMKKRAEKEKEREESLRGVSINVEEMADEELEDYSRKYFSDVQDPDVQDPRLVHRLDIFKKELLRRRLEEKRRLHDTVERLKSQIPDDKKKDADKLVSPKEVEQDEEKKPWWKLWG